MADGTPRGILSQRDRDYLLGKKSDITSSHERSIRTTIRERIDYGFRDIGFIYQNVDNEECQKAIEPFHQGSLRDAVALIYREALRLPEHERCVNNEIRNGIQDAAEDHGLIADVTLDTEFTDFDPEETLEKVNRGEGSVQEVARLLMHDEIDDEDIEITVHK